MNGITAYVFRQLVTAMLFVTLALTGVVWLSQSLRFVDLIINRGLSFFTFVNLTLLLLPSFLVILLPIALFCAVMYTYHRMTVDSELVVLRVAGLGQLDLARPALALAAIMTAVCYAFTIYLMPLGFRTFKDRQFSIRADFSRVLLQEGTFNTVAHGLTVYLRARQPNGELLGILVHDNRDPESPVTMMAERGSLLRTPQGPRLALVNGNRQEYDADNRKLGLLYFDQYSFDLSNLVEMQGDRWREPRERYLPGLLGTPTTELDRKEVDQLRAEGHQRLVSPLYCVVFALIALAGLLGGEHNQRGRLPRMFVAAGAAAIFQAIALALAHLAVNTPILIPLMYGNLALWSLAALYVLTRTRRRRKAAAGAFG